MSCVPFGFCNEVCMHPLAIIEKGFAVNCFYQLMLILLAQWGIRQCREELMNTESFKKTTPHSIGCSVPEQLSHMQGSAMIYHTQVSPYIQQRIQHHYINHATVHFNKEENFPSYRNKTIQNSSSKKDCN